MTAERWRQIEEIYHSALEVPPPQRTAFISQACLSDADLRNEVEDLVRREESPAWQFPEGPAWASQQDPAWAPQQDPVVAFAAGSRLGPYEIVEAIGAGGMGLVFRALDTRLGRSVAIKTSLGKISDRFWREARTIASLNHPNICTLYDTGPDYLVMELIEGPTLADRIRQGPLPPDEALHIARQIASALQAAHHKGIVHRDLKPANIKIRPDGSVKVLDFGLAKSAAESEPSADSVEVKRFGLIRGTAAYMSPEQALGQEVDSSADIWAFGVVLYEMLSGVRPFEGATVSDCLAGIVQNQPDLAKIPARFHRLLSRCLEKDSKQRLKNLSDWEHLLEPEQRPQSPRKVAWLAIPAVLLAAVGVWAVWSKTSVPQRATRFQIPVPDNVQFDEYIALSPDGRKLVFNATGGQSGLWIHNLETLEWRRLEGTEGGRSPFWSPDSRFLGFAVRHQLKKIDVTTGHTETLCTIPGQVGMGAWSKEGVIVFGGQGKGFIRKVPDKGGAVSDLTSLDGESVSFDNFPSFLPDGKHFLYLRAARSAAGEHDGIYMGSVDAKPAGQSPERILAIAQPAVYLDGNLLFNRAGTLMAQPFNPGTLALRGDPVPIAEHVGIIRHYSVFSASSGALAYRTGTNTQGADQLTWFDRQGKAMGTIGQPSGGIRLSPDGTRGAVRDADKKVNGDLWIVDFATGGHTRFTFRQSPGSWAAWSPDGATVFFAAGPRSDSIYAKPANGAGPEKEWLTEPGIVHQPTGFSPDGRFLLYNSEPTPTSYGLWVLRLDQSRQRVHLLASELMAGNGRISPDGRWMAYIADDSGRPEVYVRPFVSSGSAAPSFGEGRWQISRQGVDRTTPRWRGDGKELFFMDASDVIEAVDVDGSRPAFQTGTTKPLLTTPCNCGWEMTPDGQRFLVNSAIGAGGKTPITVVLNWRAELKPQ